MVFDPSLCFLINVYANYLIMLNLSIQLLKQNVIIQKQKLETMRRDWDLWWAV